MIYEEFGLEPKVEDDLLEFNLKHMKSYKKSKVLWFNLLVLVVAVLALPEFVAVLPTVWLQYAVLGGAVGNAVLRIFFTEKKLG